MEAKELMRPMRAEPSVAIDARYCESGARRNSCGTASTPPIGQCDDPSAEKRAPVWAIWGRVLRGADERCMSLCRRVSCPGSLGARGCDRNTMRARAGNPENGAAARGERDFCAGETTVSVPDRAQERSGRPPRPGHAAQADDVVRRGREAKVDSGRKHGHAA